MATTIKNSAWINDHTRGMHFAGDHTFGLNLYAAFCENYPIEPAGDHHLIAFNLAFDFSALAEDYGLL